MAGAGDPIGRYAVTLREEREQRAERLRVLRPFADVGFSHGRRGGSVDRGAAFVLAKSGPAAAEAFRIGWRIGAAERAKPKRTAAAAAAAFFERRDRR